MDPRGHRGSELGQADISLAALIRATITRLSDRHLKRLNNSEASTIHKMKQQEKSASKSGKEESPSLLGSVLVSMPKNRRQDGPIENFSLDDKETAHLTSEWVCHPFFFTPTCLNMFFT